MKFNSLYLAQQIFRLFLSYSVQSGNSAVGMNAYWRSAHVCSYRTGIVGKWSDLASTAFWQDFPNCSLKKSSYQRKLKFLSQSPIRIATLVNRWSKNPRAIMGRYTKFMTESGAHPAFYPMGTGGSFSGGKAAKALSWPLTSILYRGQERWSYTTTPPYVLMAYCLSKDRNSFTFYPQNVLKIVKVDD
jgi:hypothetical protein